MHKRAFTLVELIVVITILAILGTIAYISFQGFSQDSRDSARISDVNLINKTLKLYATRVGPYPAPDNATPIIFSGAVAWNQGEFNNGVLATISTVGKLSNVPVDPLTGSSYTYSKTATSNEYQLGAALEGPINIAYNPLISQASANDQIAYSYIRGNYNERFLSVRSGGDDYILAVPGIIASDILDAQLVTIATNQKLSYFGTSNLPSTYTGTLFAVNTPDGFNYPATADDMIVYSGSVDNLSDPVQQVQLITNLQNAYSGTVVASSLNDLMVVDITNDAQVNNYVASLTNSEVGGLASVGLSYEPVSSGGGSSSTTDVLFYVGGIDGTFSGFSSVMFDNVYASADNGITWGEVGTDSFPIDTRLCSAIYFNDKLLVLGGAGSDRIYSTTDGLSWTNEGALPQEFREFKVVEYDNKLWVLGGFDGSSASDKIFSSVDGITWIEEGITLGNPMSAATAVTVFDNKIWLLGGQIPFPVVDDVYSFNGTTLLDASDASITDLPVTTSWNQGYTLNGTMFAATGLNSDTIYSTTDGITWVDETAVNSKSKPLSGLWLTDNIVLNGKVYIVGGRIPGPNYPTVNPSVTEVFASSNGLDWTQVGDLPAGRGGGCLGRLPLTSTQITALGL